MALIQSWSGNDNLRSVAVTDASFERAVALADTARRQGCAPILVGPTPTFEQHPDLEANRVHNLDRVRAAARAGMPVLDLDALWGTGAVPNAYKPGFGVKDRLHPTDAACAAAAAVLAPMIGQALNTARAG